MLSLGIALGVLIVLVGTVIHIYNRIARLSVLADNAWSDVDVQLKRRHDLVPNLVETVRGYATHERTVLENVVRARNAALAAPTPQARIEAENQLTGALRQLFALAEAYPDLKANQNFLQLQTQLADIESDIANARRYYNAVVRDYNTRLRVLPDVFIARMAGFQDRPFFEIAEEERAPVRVQFS
jgi:LemA protein